jgi:hypothetical protein
MTKTMAPGKSQPRLYRALLIALFVVWAFLLFGGFALGPTDETNSQRIPTWARMLSSFTLAIAAWIWPLSAPTAGEKRFSLLLAIGMSLGFGGDMFLADLLPVSLLLPGMAAFGLGHVAYIYGMVCLAKERGFTRRTHWLGPLVVWLVIGTLGWLVTAYPSTESAALRWAALIYTLLIAVMAASATALALQVSAAIGLALGAALFFVSDIILAGQLYRGLHFTLINALVWLTYGPGQMLIVYGGNIAARRSGKDPDCDMMG